MSGSTMWNWLRLKTLVRETVTTLANIYKIAYVRPTETALAQSQIGRKQRGCRRIKVM